MTTPYFRTQASTSPILRLIYMVIDEKLNIKVNGLGVDRQHLLIQPNKPLMVNITVKKANSQLIEQDITITAKRYGTVTLHGFNATTKERYQSMRPLYLNILSKIAIPDSLSLEQLALLRVLLAETIKPRQSGFNLEQATLAMQYMRQALHNRLAFPVSRYLEVPVNNKTIIGLISSGAIAGFKGYPKMSKEVIDNINLFIDQCNTGSDGCFLLNRQLFQNALKIATDKLDREIYTPKLYAWRTKNSASPGNNFRVEMDLQGQTFYSLSPEFISDPHGNKKQKI